MIIIRLVLLVFLGIVFYVKIFRVYEFKRFLFVYYGVLYNFIISCLGIRFVIFFYIFIILKVFVFRFFWIFLYKVFISDMDVEGLKLRLVEVN